MLGCSFSCGAINCGMVTMLVALKIRGMAQCISVSVPRALTEFIRPGSLH